MTIGYANDTRMSRLIHILARLVMQFLFTLDTLARLAGSEIAQASKWICKDK